MTLQRPQLRKIWRLVHRWLGLWAGLHLVLLGLTGSALVFFKEVDGWLAPSRYASAAAEIPTASLNAMAKRAEAELEASVHLIYFVPGKNQATLEFWRDEDPAVPRPRSVCNFDRTKGEFLGCWVWGETVMSWVYRLHYELFMGSIGTKIVGATGVLFLILIGTGLCLWWPRSKVQWRSAFRIATIRNRVRLNYDLHRLLGLYSSFALIAIAFSGVSLSYSEFVRGAIGVFADLAPRPDPKITSQTSARAFDETLAVASKAHPGSVPVYIETPHEAGDPYEIGIKSREDWEAKGVLTDLWVDPVQQKIVAKREFNKLSLGDKFLVIQFPIHNGDILGIVGRWVVFFLGLLPSLLFFTGVVLYMKKARALKKKLESFNS